jgi:uncharacterized protein DUF3311
MSSEHKRPGLTAPWGVVLVLLAPAVVLPLLPGIYAKEDPTLWSFPFYFWFQFALILVAVALTLPAYVLAQVADRRDRVRHGLPPVPDGTGSHRKAGDEQ